MTDLPPPSGPPPGWYPDPSTGQGFRWWDGMAWTDQTSASAQPVQPAGDRLMAPAEWLRQAVRTGASRAGHFFPMVVLVLLPTTLLNGLAAWFALHNAVLLTDSDTGAITFTNPSGGPGRYALVAASSVLLLASTVLLAVSATRQALAVLDEAPEPWSVSMLAALRRLPAALLVGLAVGGTVVGLYALLLVSGAVSPALLLITLPLWIVGSLLAAVRLSLALCAVTVAPVPRRGLGLSWTLTRSRFWALLGRLALLVVVGLMFSILSNLVAAPLVAIVGGAASSGASPTANEIHFVEFMGDNPAVFAISQVFNALGNGAATIVWAIGMLLIYRSLKGPIAPRVVLDDGSAAGPGLAAQGTDD